MPCGLGGFLLFYNNALCYRNKISQSRFLFHCGITPCALVLLRSDEFTVPSTRVSQLRSITVPNLSSKDKCKNIQIALQKTSLNSVFHTSFLNIA